MREYEMVYVMQPNMSETQINQVNERMKNVIEKFDGHLFYARSLGQRSLAYRIKKQTKGIYYVLDFAAKGDCVTDMERSLLLDENILRFLTVTKAETVDVEARTAEVEARGEALAAPEEKEASSVETTLKEGEAQEE